MPFFSNKSKSIKEKLLPSNVQRSWTEAVDHSYRMTIATILSVATIVLLSYKIVTTKPVTIVIPPQLNETITIVGNKAGESYKKLWGIHIASMLGNASERSVKVVLEALKPMLSVADYDVMSEQLSTHVKALALRYQTQKYTVQDTYYDPKRDIIYIYGDRELISKKKVTAKKAGMKPIRWTYEITIKQAGGKTKMPYITQYEGTPRFDSNRLEKK